MRGRRADGEYVPHGRGGRDGDDGVRANMRRCRTNDSKSDDDAECGRERRGDGIEDGKGISRSLMRLLTMVVDAMTKARGACVVRSLVVQPGRAVVVEDMMAVVVPTMAEGSSVWL